MELAKMEKRHEMDRGNFIYLRNKDTNSGLEILRKCTTTAISIGHIKHVVVQKYQPP